MTDHQPPTGAQSGRRAPTRAVAVIAALVTLAALVGGTGNSPADAQAIPPVGIVCTDGPTFELTTQTGYISLPDGNTMYMWGYSAGGGGFQHPSPVLCVNQGDTVNVVLNNTLSEPVSISFPGQENVTVGGVPVGPEIDGGGAVTSLTNSVAPGGSITYSFVASEPGTYLYQSGTNPAIQVRMGLFGALIVRPSGQPDQVYGTADSAFEPSEEFMVLLSEIDPYLHQAVEQGIPFNLDNYHARYWLLNGRGFPDVVADNGATWLPTQPYGGLAEVQPFNDTLPPGDPNYHPRPALARYLNVTSEDMPAHPHGNNGRVVGRDGRPLKDGGQDISFEKFTINIGPGQTWDVLFQWYDPEGYSPTNPVPVTIPSAFNVELGVFYSGSPYLGHQEEAPVGVPTVNQCGEFYIISHNHALYQITSWGALMTGPITFMRINPPLPNNCP